LTESINGKIKVNNEHCSWTLNREFSLCTLSTFDLIDLFYFLFFFYFRFLFFGQPVMRTLLWAIFLFTKILSRIIECPEEKNGKRQEKENRSLWGQSNTIICWFFSQATIFFLQLFKMCRHICSTLGATLIHHWSSIA
jgi:hypothetical protein